MPNQEKGYPHRYPCENNNYSLVRLVDVKIAERASHCAGDDQHPFSSLLPGTRNHLANARFFSCLSGLASRWGRLSDQQPFRWECRRKIESL